MTFLRAVASYVLAGLLVQLLWPMVAAPTGYLAGVLGGVLVIAPTWYLVHYRGWIPSKDSHLAVDMGMAVGTTVLVRSLLTHGWSQAVEALPTLICLLLGASLSGLVYAHLQRRKSR